MISGVVPDRALASYSEATKLVLAMGIVSLASVRGPAPREQCSLKGCVPVPLLCCDSDASGNQSCGCASLQRCLFYSPLILISCSSPEIFHSRLVFRGFFCQGFENRELQTMSPVPTLTPGGWGWSSAARVLYHAHTCLTSKAPNHCGAEVPSGVLGLGLFVWGLSQKSCV